MRLQSCSDRSDLDELRYPDLLRIGVESDHEMGSEVLFENRQTPPPAPLGRMKDTGSRRVQWHWLVEMGNPSDMSYWEFASLVQPGLNVIRHRVSSKSFCIHILITF